MKDRFAAVLTNRGNFASVRSLGHDDVAWDLLVSGHVGDRLAVVAGRSGHDSGCRAKGDSWSTLLDTPRGLKLPVFWRFSAFSHTSKPGALAQGTGREKGSPVDEPLDALGRAHDIVQARSEGVFVHG